MDDVADARKRQVVTEREQLLDRVVVWLEPPMTVLGFIWLLLLIVDLVSGLTPLLTALGTAIWVVFILDFVLEFLIAPRKFHYLRANWLTALALVAPAVRVLRIARFARLLRTTRAAREFGLLRILGSFNRGMSALGATLGRRGFGYVVGLTVMVTLLGAAGMYAFEPHGEASKAFQNYPQALWWTAMLVTTMGSGYWPETGRGQLLCLLLAVYAFAVFGYVTATLARFFIDRDAARDDAQVAGAGEMLKIREELVRLREEVAALARSARIDGVRGQ